MLSWLALAAAAAPPAPPSLPTFQRVLCFDEPLFYDPGVRELTGEDRKNLDRALAWLTREPVRSEVRIVLRMNTRENPYDNPTVPLLFERPDDLRSLLISKGIGADRILLANEMWGDRNIEIRFDLNGFKGAWIQPEFYLSDATMEKLRSEAEPRTSTLGPDPCSIPRPASAPASPPGPPAGPSAPKPAEPRPRAR